MLKDQIHIISDNEEFKEKVNRLVAELKACGAEIRVLSHQDYNTMNELNRRRNLVVGGHNENMGYSSGSTNSMSSNSMSSNSMNVIPFPSNQPEESQEIQSITNLEKRAIKDAILKVNGNLSGAAKALGIGRATLYRKVKQYGLDISLLRKQKRAA